MNSSTPLTYAKAIGIGAVAGMRAMSAPALLSYTATNSRDKGLGKTVLASQNVSAALAVLALGEMIADQFPGMPDRISTPSLIARAGSGALVGATVFASRKKPAGVGAALGALAAVAAAFASFHLRRKADEKLGGRDHLAALAEDSIVIGAGLSVLRAL
jgi:uncharacterized membrane protein